jgi:acyl-CoA synthetase (AMP-forming)/AMP-acid ligase II
VEHVVKKHNGIFLPVYVESRGAKEFLREQEELKRDGKEQEAFQKLMEKYCPLIEDTGNIFAAMNPNMMVAPAAVLIDHLPLLMGLEPDEPIESLELVISGGDELTPEMYEVLKEKFPNAEIVPYLGHFMLGAAFGRKGLNYFPNAAGTLLDVVDESGETVNYGKKGRVVINFYDTMLWRVKDDVGKRVEPKDDLAWDGVSDISRYME